MKALRKVLRDPFMSSTKGSLMGYLRGEGKDTYVQWRERVARSSPGSCSQLFIMEAVPRGSCEGAEPTWPLVAPTQHRELWDMGDEAVPQGWGLSTHLRLPHSTECSRIWGMPKLLSTGVRNTMPKVLFSSPFMTEITSAPAT